MYKFLERRLDAIMEAPHVMITHEKHGIRVWDASSRESLFKNALEILKERLEFGYIYKPDPEYLQKYDPKMTSEEIDRLPDSLVKQAALKQIKQFRHMKEEFEQDQKHWEDVQSAIHNEDGERAFVLLADRSDYEYESITFEPILGA